ncbi:helix-turn-helix transcriptional regulator [Altererythrobacter sp. MTPC7]|uniref:helix-turn-helix transcriptional regulator n=1 Tax=Altererythrobacter sp. MTPC7 TaxID=3056567 RepID=UPI0036F42063
MPLTDKELEVAFAVATDKSALRIASQTVHSVHTVRNQIKSALRSTGRHSQSQLASLVRDWLF